MLDLILETGDNLSKSHGKWQKEIKFFMTLKSIILAIRYLNKAILDDSYKSNSIVKINGSHSFHSIQIFYANQYIHQGITVNSYTKLNNVQKYHNREFMVRIAKS